jgi:hypothetical protein
MDGPFAQIYKKQQASYPFSFQIKLLFIECTSPLPSLAKYSIAGTSTNLTITASVGGPQ